MCAVKSYLVSAFLVASALGQQQQWNNFPSLQGFELQDQTNQDQQLQASDYSGGYDFSSHGNSEGFLSLGGQKTLGGSDQGGHFGGHHQGGHFGGHDLGGHFGGQHAVHSYPVHQHIEEENPEPIKHYKEIVVPIPKNVQFKINQPVIIPVPHPVPIQVPVPKAVVIPIIKEVSIPVEKSVPYPVEKQVHVPKIKEVPFEVVKHVIVPVEKPVPFKVPVYETIIHTKKGSHKI